MAISYTARGSNVSTGTTATITGVVVGAGGSLLVGLACGADVAAVPLLPDTVVWGSATLVLDRVQAAVAGKYHCGAVYRGSGLTPGTNNLVATWSNDPTGPKAMAAVEVVNLSGAPLDKQGSSAVASSSQANAGNVTIVQASEFLFGVISTGGPPADQAGSWGFSFAGGARVGSATSPGGTTPGVTLSIGQRIASSISSYTAFKTSMTVRSQVAIICTYKEGAPASPTTITPAALSVSVSVQAPRLNVALAPAALAVACSTVTPSAFATGGVQLTMRACSGTGSTTGVTFTNITVPAGHSLFVAIAYTTAVNSVFWGATELLASNFVNNGSLVRGEVYELHNSPGGAARDVTITLSPASKLAVAIFTASGLRVSPGPFERVKTAVGAGTTQSAGSFGPLSASRELVLCLLAVDQPNPGSPADVWQNGFSALGFCGSAAAGQPGVKIGYRVTSQVESPNPGVTGAVSANFAAVATSYVTGVDSTITPAALTVAFTHPAHTLLFSGGKVQPAARTVVTSTPAPLLISPRVLTPAALTVVVSPRTPQSQASQRMTARSVAFTTVTPTVLRGNKTMLPAVLTVALSTQTPSVIKGAFKALPATLGIAFTRVAPTLLTGGVKTPAARSVAFTTVTPLVVAGAFVARPAALVVSFTRGVPRLSVVQRPAARTIAMTTQTPTVIGGGARYTPAVLVLVAATATPSVLRGGRILTPAVLGVVAVTQTPLVKRGGVVALPASRTIATSTLAPLVLKGGFTAVPAARSVAFSLATRTVLAGNVTRAPGALLVTMATQAPSAKSGGKVLSPAARSVSFTAQTPAAGSAGTMAPATRTVTFSTATPLVLRGNRTLTPAARSVSTSVPAPSLVSVARVSPGSRTVTFSTVAPTVSGNIPALTPAARAVNVTVPAPTLLSGGKVLLPAARSVTMIAAGGSAVVGGGERPIDVDVRMNLWSGEDEVQLEAG